MFLYSTYYSNNLESNCSKISIKIWNTYLLSGNYNLTLFQIYIFNVLNEFSVSLYFYKYFIFAKLSASIEIHSLHKLNNYNYDISGLATVSLGH